MLTWLILFFMITSGKTLEDSIIKFILTHEENQGHFVGWFEDALRKIESSSSSGVKLDLYVVVVSNDTIELDRVCYGFAQGGRLIIDVTWTGNEELKNQAKQLNVPYVRIDLSISPILNLLDKYLDHRNSSDVAIIFHDPKLVDEALYYWIGSTRMRMVLTDALDETSAKRLRKMKPMPNNYAIVSASSKMASLLKTSLDENLLKIPERWNLVFLDFGYDRVKNELSRSAQINIIIPSEETCCALLDLSDCACPDDFVTQKQFLYTIVRMLSKITNRLNKERLLTTNVRCNDAYENSTAEFFENLLTDETTKSKTVQLGESLRLKIKGIVKIVSEDNSIEDLATYDEDNGITLAKGKEIKPVRAFYRVGVTEAIPWAYKEIDAKTGEVYWTGYCLDLVAKLAEMLDFDYETVEPEIGTFGKRDRMGNWDGIVGDLQRGETDLAVSALIMTADREEIIDFVAPYFEQSGISIVMRKPVRKTSLFKFMTVLKLEVWMSIVGALTVTGFMIWFLEKYSPYSARNNKKAHPYPCRDFTLKESFWFALTSFTPQGGGEAPKALSGRTLVAAYWLFVVLMLATFTANLAAFLTVERMQTPVQSLEQLAKQSRINYTVVEGSETHKYFINMKNAEDTLYRMWKELTLNASTEETQYRVWDYPIREQYGHILLAINDSIPFANATEGFAKVDERTDADFAFIHDSSEIKYEISRNCNFTEVGEVFAEKPYAVAIQQGSWLQEDIGIAILDLQKDRFFDFLQAKYWNHSTKGSCHNVDESEGITLESLGGVFIATLFGLALALVTLAGEVLYYRRKRLNKEKKKQAKNPFLDVPGPKRVHPETITIGSTFKPVQSEKEKIRVSHIALYPRARNRLPHVN